MTPLKQTILHDPENGQYGNCMQAAIASLFDLHIEQVPHFGDGLGDDEGEKQQAQIIKWLQNSMDDSYGIIGFSITDKHHKGWCEFLEHSTGYHLISGWTARGTYHVVVGKGGVEVFDVHPSGIGLLQPTEDKPWYIEFIVKRFE